MATKQKTSRNADEQRLREFIAAGSHRVAMMIYPGLSSYDSCGCAELFSTANGQLKRDGRTTRDIYELELISPTPGPVVMEMGLKIMPDRTISDPERPIDTLIVSGGNWDPVKAACEDKNLIAWLKATAPKVKRIASMCTGAFLMAEAGLAKSGITTHWAHCDRMRQLHPKLEVHSDRIFVKERNVYSSAGGSAAMDLTLALIEEDLGRKLAMDVARRMVMFLKRPGGQSQFSATLLAQAAGSDVLRGLPEWIADNLAEDLSVEALAARAGMRPRNFARIFLSETGLTPAKYVERARLENARVLIEQTAMPVTSVAHKSGFESDQQMRRAFVRWLNVTPADYIARFRTSSFDGGLIVDTQRRRPERPKEQPWLP